MMKTSLDFYLCLLHLICHGPFLGLHERVKISELKCPVLNVSWLSILSIFLFVVVVELQT